MCHARRAESQGARVVPLRSTVCLLPPEVSAGCPSAQTGTDPLERGQATQGTPQLPQHENKDVSRGSMLSRSGLEICEIRPSLAVCLLAQPVPARSGGSDGTGWATPTLPAGSRASSHT